MVKEFSNLMNKWTRGTRFHSKCLQCLELTCKGGSRKASKTATQAAEMHGASGTNCAAEMQGPSGTRGRGAGVGQARCAGGCMRARCCCRPAGPRTVRTSCKHALQLGRGSRSRAAPETQDQRGAPAVVRSECCAHGQVHAGCAVAGHAPGAPGLASTEAGTVASGAHEPTPAAGAGVWAEQSDMSLYHSAQGSFGVSSTASSAYASAMHMERSVARSRVQRAPLAEEDEDQGSDADSFFSASDDGHEAEGECRSVRARLRMPLLPAAVAAAEKRGR